MGQLRQSVKHLNLFKRADDRAEESVKRQKIITRVYLILLTGNIPIFPFKSIHTYENLPPYSTSLVPIPLMTSHKSLTPPSGMISHLDWSFRAEIFSNEWS